MSDCTICEAKTKVLISCEVTAQLICAFVFAYADCWFCDTVAQVKYDPSWASSLCHCSIFCKTLRSSLSYTKDGGQ